MQPTFAETSLSNQGGRELNEDYTLSFSRGDTYCRVVADGLGGHHGGEVASRVACEAALRSFQANPAVMPDALLQHIRNADDAVRQEQRANPSLQQMKSTVAMLVANATHAVYGHAGDTRLYHFRAGRVFQQSRDHSVPQSLVDAGEIAASEIRHHEDRSRLLRALGEEQPVRASVIPAPVPIGRGDAFLLCTDGFWENVVETEMEIDLSKSATPADWLHYMENRLQERVSGAFDNYTAAAVLCDGLSSAPQAPVRGSLQQKPPQRRKRASRLVLNLAVFLVVPLLLFFAMFFLVSHPPQGTAHGASPAVKHAPGLPPKDKPAAKPKPAGPSQ
jgi:PPM family protein phosphatase